MIISKIMVSGIHGHSIFFPPATKNWEMSLMLLIFLNTMKIVVRINSTEILKQRAKKLIVPSLATVSGVAQSASG